MSQENVTDNEQEHSSLVIAPVTRRREVEIPSALSVRLQTLDVARHIAITPQGKRYVVATFNDSAIGRSYVTAIYPQQNQYLTLVRLVVREFVSSTEEQAVQRHISVVQSIQQGKLNELQTSNAQ